MLTSPPSRLLAILATCLVAGCATADTSGDGTYTGATDTGVKADESGPPSDTGGSPTDDTGAPTDDTGSPTDDTGSDGGGVCTPKCTTDFDCDSTCPAASSGNANCCDTATGVCYVSATACPAPTSPDSGPKPPY